MSTGMGSGDGAYVSDDVALVWLAPSLQNVDYKAAEAYLKQQAGALGIVQLLDKNDLTHLYHNPFGNSRTPDFVAITQHGLIYTGGTKLAEHGGFSPDDRNVGMLVSNPAITAAMDTDFVETRQIAPTVLDALGLNPKDLDGVREEKTQILPGQY
jgi:hypothetical protein